MAPRASMAKSRAMGSGLAPCIKQKKARPDPGLRPSPRIRYSLGNGRPDPAHEDDQIRWLPLGSSVSADVF